MLTHEQKVNDIIEQLILHDTTKPVSLRKKAVSHEVPKPNDKRHSDKKIDIRDLNEILFIDPEKQICIAEPGITFVDLVRSTVIPGFSLFMKSISNLVAVSLPVRLLCPKANIFILPVIPFSLYYTTFKTANQF